MKGKSILKYLFIVCILNSKINAQVSTPGNTAIPTGFEYVGWDNGTNLPLEIKNESTNPINFYTTGGIAAFNHLRARIFEDNLTAPDGVTLQNVGRMQISEDDATFGAFPVIPVSLLHLGHRWITGAGGHRRWMDVGTYTNARNDNMYFGLKHEFDPVGNSQVLWDDHMDAVISWGDNAAQPDNFNDLRFIFATPIGINGVSGTNDGLETMRLSWNGNVGIGNFYIAGQPPLTNSIRPFRRLEVLDGGRNQPQFRLTHTQQNGVGTGIFTDFQTTILGDLFINPTDNGTNRRVGINTDVPVRTLEVFENSPDPQLRLTHIISAVPATRRFADFRVSGNGDLIITPTRGNSDGNVGINTITAPGNTLTITSPTVGNSGLRFTSLTSAFVPTALSTGNVLTVDASGDVILVPDQGAGSINACGGSLNLYHIMKYNNSTGTTACQASMQEDANGFVGIGVAPITNQGVSVVYTNPSTGNSTGIAVATSSALGTNTGINLYTNDFDNTLYGTHFRTASNANTIANSHKYGHFVDLNGNSEYNTGYYSNITGGGSTLYSYGFYGRVTGAVKGANPTNYGVEVEATGDITTTNYGVHGTGFAGKKAIGVYGYGHGAPLNIGVDAVGYGDDGTEVYGVRAEAYSPALNNYGVHGYAATGTNNYAIYGETPVGTCSTASCTDAAGYFDGDVYISQSLYVTSDLKFKQNITDAQNVSAIIDALQPKTYTFDSINYPGINLPSGMHYGLIAQDVENILPGLVKRTRQPEAYDSTGAIITPGVDYKALNYIELVPILLAEIKTQKHNMDSVMAVLSTLVASPVNNSGNKIGNHNQKIELSNNQGIILNQNDPNPFAESTQISYFIPDGIKEAKIMFSDNKGRVLRSAKIETLGEGTLEVYASDLSSGIYTYTLVCDGKVIDSKKMVKQ